MRRLLALSAILCALLFFSCDNMSGGGSDSAQQSAPTQTAPASNPTAPSSGQEIYVVFRGSVGVRGALPKEVSANVAALENSIPAGDGCDLQLVSKSAEPGLNVNGTDYYYYVIATPQDSVGNTTVSFDGKGETGEEVDAKFKRGENGITYELALKIGKWKIECGIKNKGGAPVLRDITDVIELTPTDSVINKSFVATPAPDSGNGSVLLYFDLGDASSTIASAVARYKDSEGTEQSKTLVDATTLDPVGPNENLALKLDSVAPGAYEMAISFYNATGVMVYQTVQTVNVFGGMKTDTWVSGGGTDAETNLITGDGFIINTDAVNLFKSSTLYVGATGATGAKAPNDANEGSAYAPFEHLQKAFDTIAANGSGTADYKIYVCGTVTTNAELSSSVNGKARSLTVEGFALTTGGAEPTDTLCGEGAGKGPVLTISSSVPVTVKNLVIKNGSANGSEDQNSRGGGINAKTGSNLTLDGGAIIENNYASQRGGGVACAGTLAIKNCKIRNNEAGYYGGGLFCEAASGSDSIAAKIGNSSALIEKNKVTDSSESWIGFGGGVYVGNKTTLEMTAGTIEGNSAVHGGGGIRISGTDAKFNMGGSAKICGNTADQQGGGVDSDHIFNMTGGEISQNTSPMGGAVASTGESFSISGSAKIPYGVTKNGATETGFGKNDVGLFSDACVVVAGSFTSSGTVATLTPINKNRGTAVLKKSSGEITADDCGHFGISSLGFNIKKSKQTDHLDLGVLSAPIYVSEKSGAEDGSNEEGTQTHPFKTLAYAVSKLSGGEPDTIFIDGNLTANQSIPSTFTASNCSSLTIMGANNLENGQIKDKDNPTDAIAIPSDGSGTALTINSAVPITIFNLKITGGKVGGIKIEGSDTSRLNVTLKDMLITGNSNTGNGMGLYASYADVTMQSGSISGNSGTYTGSHGGVALDHSSKFFMYGGKVSGNTAKQFGGNLYLNGSSEFILNDGEISGGLVESSTTEVSGGGAWIDGSSTLTMKGGEIKGNKTNYKGSSSSSKSQGGGVYVATGTFDMQGGKMSGNQTVSTMGNVLGGAVIVQSGGTLKLSGTACIQYENDNKHDVYLRYGKTVTVDSFTGDAPTVAAITLEYWTRKTNYLSSSNVITPALTGKFVLTKDDAGWNKEIESTYKKTAYIDSPIYVASSDETDDTRKVCSAAPASGNTGLKNKPYATIAAALADSALSQVDNTITIDGTLKGVQTTGDSVTASSVTIKGYDTNATINGNASGSALTIAAAKTFTVQQLNITGGSATQGGGINITAAATVNLNSGAKIYGNATKTPGSGYGGGVYVCSGATLNINNGSEIYSNTALSGDYCSGGGVFSEGTVNVKTGSKLYKNSAKNGGAIYNVGSLVMSGGTIGGSADDKNTAKYGGGINNASGKEVTISGGELSYNSATDDSGEQVCGGAILNYGKITISDAATISYNTASETNTTSGSAKGGGISNWYGGELIISGAVTMNGNETSASAAGYASQGGAIYNYGTLTMSNGTIGASGALNVVKGQGKQGGAIYQRGTFNISGSATIFPGSQTSNDVYLESEKTITINADYTGSGNNGSSKMFVTPSAWTRGLAILGGAKLTTTNKGYFSIPDTDWSVVTTGSAGALTGYINADIYVSSSGSDSYTGASLLKAFKTIAAAAKVCNSYKNEIKVSGTFNMSQEIPTDVTASSITLTGINSAKIDTTESKDAFTVAKALTLTITDITFKGATTTNKAGINISNSSADVRLGSGVKVEGNYNGISNSGKLCLYGDAMVGKNVDGLPTAANNAGNSFYGIKNNSGQLWIGYSEPAADKADTSFSGGVKKNWNRGIYIGSGTAYISKGAISFNAGGGIDNEGNLTISGGNIDNNKTTNGGGIFNGGTLTISGNATINSNEATSSGGGIYHNSSYLLTISGGEISSNTGSGITVASSSNHYIVMTGGKICKNTGRGVYLNSKSTFVMSGSASIGDSTNSSSGNTGGGLHTSGGNVYLGYTYNNGTISAISGSMTGGIFYNSAADGGGMYIASGSSVYLAAGTISGNSSTSNGGAIYHAGAGLHIKGSASLPCTGAHQNDVYLAKVSSVLKQITVDGALGGTGTVATITPEEYDNSYQAISLGAGASDITLVQAKSRFVITDNITTDSFIWGLSSSGKLYKGKSAAQAIAAISSLSGTGNTLELTGPLSKDEVTSITTALKNSSDTTLRVKLDLSGCDLPEGLAVAAFSSCGRYSEIILPEGLTELPNNCFLESSNITKVTLPSTLTKLGTRTFYDVNADIILRDGCTAFKQQNGAIYSTNGKKLYLFTNRQTANTSFQVPNTVEEIDECAFDGSINLKTVTFQTNSKLSKIGWGAFRDCSGLTSVTLPAVSPITLGQSIFIRCKSLTTFTIPNGWESIPYGTFDYCTNLQSVVIPTSVTRVSMDCFDQCTSLTSVKYRGSETQWNAISINENNNSYFINAPKTYNYTGS
ncbi:MAG: leucine-rich repeat protein [Treponema sp.]|nr:leucine-rich repeat protein [Treponema sp.]